MRRDKLLAYAQLVRLPNVFTAFADIALGACAAGYMSERLGTLALLLLASGCLYAAGMALNDLNDRADDARHRPFRPIPSGRVSPRAAGLVGGGLLLAGVGWAGLATLAGPALKPTFAPLPVAAALAVMIVMYDTQAKTTAAAPVAMGLCRFLNVLLGLSAGASGSVDDPVALHLALVVGLYIVGVTWFARTEEGESKRTHLLAAAAVMLAALVLALLLPAQLGPRIVWQRLPYPFLLVAVGFHVGLPVAAAIREPSPKRVQVAVKRCVLGLVLLDAVLATAFVGPPGLLIALLLVPALYLGRWVYST